MDLYKELIAQLTTFLKSMGFSKKGNSFYLEVDKNYGVINFQKSRDSTSETILFTINFGIYSNLLERMRLGYSESKKPEVEQCHWHARIGNFMPGGPDYWWKVNASADLRNIVSSVMDDIKNVVMPEISKRLSDEGLINSWMNESYAGTTEIGRFKYLTTLLKAKGNASLLHQVVEKFMQQYNGRPNASMAMQHLRDIEYSK